MSRQHLKPPDPHPALVQHARERAALVQNRIADRITPYAGSMHFVYLHVLLFVGWMLLIEKSPWPTLTLIVSLEAIFLSTCVMISQNRADEKRQIMAAQEWKSVQLEESQNEELLRLSKQILELTNAIHTLTVKGGQGRRHRSRTTPERESRAPRSRHPIAVFWQGGEYLLQVELPDRPDARLDIVRRPQDPGSGYDRRPRPRCS